VFFAVSEGIMLLLHGFIKKKPGDPGAEAEVGGTPKEGI
jgi:hypothetical protein